MKSHINFMTASIMGDQPVKYIWVNTDKIKPS